MSNVVNLNNALQFLPANRLLQLAIDADLESAIVLGWTKDGERYIASSLVDAPEMLWLLKQAERDLLASGDEDET